MNAYLAVVQVGAAAGLLACTATWAPGAPAMAGAPYAGLDRGDVVVATIQKVSSHAATNASPPRVELLIEQVLRGDPAADRRHAVWEGSVCDVDWAGEGANEALERWKTTPVANPKVGEKMILWGQLKTEPKGRAFHVFSYSRHPFSEECLAWAKSRIKTDESDRRNREVQSAAVQWLESGKRAPAQATASWRAKVSADDIRRFTRQADLVGVGRIVTARTSNIPPVGLHFEVAQILKGQTRDLTEILENRKSALLKDNLYRLDISVPKQLSPLLDCQTEYLLFLTEKGVRFFSGRPFYARIPSGDGIVIADRAALAAVKAGLRESPPKPAKQPILLLQVAGNVYYAGDARYGDPESSEQYRRQVETHFKKAAEGKFTVLDILGFPPGASSVTEKDRTREINPTGNVLVMVNFQKVLHPAEGPAKLWAWGVRLGTHGKQMVFDGQWTLAGEKELAAKAAEVIQKLVASPPIPKRAEPRR